MNKRIFGFARNVVLKSQLLRTSVFQVLPAPDYLSLQVPDSGMARGGSLTTKDSGGLLPRK